MVSPSTVTSSVPYSSLKNLGLHLPRAPQCAMASVTITGRSGLRYSRSYWSRLSPARRSIWSTSCMFSLLVVEGLIQKVGQSRHVRLEEHVVPVAAVWPYMFDNVPGHAFPVVGPVAGAAPGLAREKHVDPPGIEPGLVALD